MPKFYKWTVEIEVAAEWVADGFNLVDGDEVADMLLSGRLSHCRSDEVRGRVVQAPDADSIRHEQGEFLAAAAAKELTEPQRRGLLARVNDRMRHVDIRVLRALNERSLLDGDGDPTSYGRAVAVVLGA